MLSLSLCKTHNVFRYHTSFTSPTPLHETNVHSLILAPSPHRFLSPHSITPMEDSPGADNTDRSDKPPTLSDSRRNSKRITPTIPASVLSVSAPCGACKFLRRKCVNGCIFAPYFGSDQGSARFAAVHKVFGASNVSKLLLHIPVNQRHDAVVTISYEAQARLSDPVYGCVSTILALQQQVASLQAELSMVQTQLINSRLAVANALQNSQQQQQQHQQHFAVLQPAYSNNSSASNNLVNMSNFPTNFDVTTDAAPTSQSFKPLQLSGPLQEEDEDEEDSQNPDLFSNQLLHRK